MSKDYYEIGDYHVFLDYYLDSYKTEYRREKVAKIASLFPKLQGKRVLEIGCGGGIYSLIAKKKGAQEIALLDISRTRVKGAELNLKRLCSGSSCSGLVADAVALPFIDGYFDFVLLIDVIEHIKPDDKFLCEVRRVTREGGFMVVSTQNRNSLNFLIEAHLQRLILRNQNWMGWDTTHLRFYNGKQLHKMLTESCLYPVEIIGTYFVPYLIATSYIRCTGCRISDIAYKLLFSINKKLEKNSSNVNLFGWGIILLCQKIDCLVL